MVDPSRRSLLKWCTHVLGAVIGAILGVPAIAYLVDARNRAAPASDFRPAGLPRYLAFPPELRTLNGAEPSR